MAKFTRVKNREMLFRVDRYRLLRFDQFHAHVVQHVPGCRGEGYVQQDQNDRPVEFLRHDADKILFSNISRREYPQRYRAHRMGLEKRET